MSQRLSASAERYAKWSRHIDEVRLEGDYPSTAIVVTYRDRDRQRRKEYSLWDSHFAGPSGNRLHPELIATLIGSEFESP